METEDRLFTTCDFASKICYENFKCLGVVIVLPGNIARDFSTFDPERKIWEGDDVSLAYWLFGKLEGNEW